LVPAVTRLGFSSGAITNKKGRKEERKGRKERKNKGEEEGTGGSKGKRKATVPPLIFPTSNPDCNN